VELKRGDHISFYRSAAYYYHHAIVVAVSPTEIVIISFTNPSQDALFNSFALSSNPKGYQATKKYARIHRESITKDEFALEVVYVYDYEGNCNDADTVVSRAASVESGYTPWDEYSLVSNNCEHFATWCKIGQKNSKQVETVSTVATTAGVAGVAILGGILAYAWKKSNEQENIKERRY